MANRLTRRKKAVIGCIFAACCAAAAISGTPAQGAYLSLATVMYADSGVMTSGQYDWISSDGPLNTSLLPGQETLQGSAGDAYVSQGMTGYRSAKSLDTRDTQDWQSQTRFRHEDIGIHDDRLMMAGDGSAGIPVQCDGGTGMNIQTSEQLNESVELASTPYSEYVVQQVSGIATGGEYQSGKSVSQADTEIPDELNFEINATGTGFSKRTMLARSQAGLDQNSSELNFEQHAYQDDIAIGEYERSDALTFSSFKSVFAEGEIDD